MDIWTLDFETYYSADYTLSKMTTEEYIRDPRFETILCGFKRNNEKSYWVDQKDVAAEIARIDLPNNALLAHHAHFDGLILSHHYGVYPKVVFDTLSMARAAIGQKVRMSLSSLAERFKIGHKGTEVVMAKGKRRADFGTHDLNRYGEYCCNDVDLEWELFNLLLPAFSKTELKIADMVLRMFTEPRLHLNSALLEEYRDDIQADKLGALLRAGIQLPDVMSDAKFAEALERLGVMPPTKISPRTGREAFAFAKTDQAMEALAEHPDEDVQILIAARLKNKTTSAESRATRMAAMGRRGPAPVYLKYSGAEQTHRLSGGDKMNWQNMGRGSKLRAAVEAPPGSGVCVGDSSNIESRVLDWLAGQNDVVEVYRKADAGTGPDIYCVMAERIYSRAVNKKENPDERQMGKTAKLGLGFGMGHMKFVSAVRTQAKRVITPDESQLIVNVYRQSHPMVMELHKRAEAALGFIFKGEEGKPVDFRGIVTTCKEGLLLPNGMKIKYPDLQFTPGRGESAGYSYFDGRARTKIYGGKVVENCIAAGTNVLTAMGWVPIELVGDAALVWDGVDFVPHGGVIYKSVQPCTLVDGVRMTADHEVLTDEGWKIALEEPEPVRADVWETHSYKPCGVGREEDALGIPLPVWRAGGEGRDRRNEGGEARGHPELRVHIGGTRSSEEPHPRPEQAPCVRSMEKHAGSVQASIAQGLQELRSAGDICVPAVGDVRGVLAEHGGNVPPRTDAGTHGQQLGVLPGELRVGNSPRAGQEPPQLSACGHPGAVNAAGGVAVNAVLPMEPRPVYDILNCGPRQRFVVAGASGPFIVHNCVQALARIIVMEQTLDINTYMPVVLSVHDEAVAVTDEDDCKDATDFMLGAMRKPPVWAPDLPLNSEGGFNQSYGKAKK